MADNNIYPPFKNPLGRPLKYTPEKLAEKFAKYVDWCRANPINTHTIATFKDGFADYNTEKPRLVSIDGFLVFLGTDFSWWMHLDDGKRASEFFKVKSYIKTFCESYQKEMASVGVFKENIVSRLLGLADRQKVEASVQTYDFKFGEGGEK